MSQVCCAGTCMLCMTCTGRWALFLPMTGWICGLLKSIFCWMCARFGLLVLNCLLDLVFWDTTGADPGGIQFGTVCIAFFALIMFPSVNWPCDTRTLACVSFLFPFPGFCLLFESYFFFDISIGWFSSGCNSFGPWIDFLMFLGLVFMFSKVAFWTLSISTGGWLPKFISVWIPRLCSVFVAMSMSKIWSPKLIWLMHGQIRTCMENI